LYAAAGADAGWYFGQRLRNRGSLHSDIWEGTAADLASRHAIAVYPTGDWWREKPALQRADRHVRYALVVSLRAPVQVDLYTPIETVVGKLWRWKCEFAGERKSGGTRRSNQ
jgi:hypothetical protein